MNFLLFFIISTAISLIVGLQIYSNASEDNWRDTPLGAERKKSKKINKIIILFIAWVIIEEIGAKLFL